MVELLNSAARSKHIMYKLYAVGAYTICNVYCNGFQLVNTQHAVSDGKFINLKQRPRANEVDRITHFVIINHTRFRVVIGRV